MLSYFYLKKNIPLWNISNMKYQLFDGYEYVGKAKAWLQ